jgi:hypothetical protein
VRVNSVPNRKRYVKDNDERIIIIDVQYFIH